MNEFDRELIREMTANIRNCPNEKCTTCVGSTNIIDKQVDTAMERFLKLEKENEELKKLLEEKK